MRFSLLVPGWIGVPVTRWMLLVLQLFAGGGREREREKERERESERERERKRERERREREIQLRWCIELLKLNQFTPAPHHPSLVFLMIWNL